MSTKVLQFLCLNLGIKVNAAQIFIICSAFHYYLVEPPFQITY